MTSDDMTDMHALSGAYAVDAVDDIERAAFERHLEDCPECREEVAGFRAVALELSVLIRATPPVSLREQVLSDISSVRPLPPEVRRQAGDRIEANSRTARTDDTAPGRHAAQRPGRSRRWLAAAAAVVALGGGATVVALHPWDRQSQQQQTLADRVQQAPDAQRFSTKLSDGGTMTVVRSQSVGRAVLITQNTAAPSGKTYQMWLQATDGNFASAGLVPAGSNETVLLDGNAATAKGAGVSVEPTGGSPQPTTTPVALFAFA
jgi:anti-sigma-K factor RskA